MMPRDHTQKQARASAKQAVKSPAFHIDGIPVQNGAFSWHLDMGTSSFITTTDCRPALFSSCSLLARDRVPA